VRLLLFLRPGSAVERRVTFPGPPGRSASGGPPAQAPPRPRHPRPPHRDLAGAARPGTAVLSPGRRAPRRPRPGPVRARG
jgi:hypothetical protein